MSDTAVLSEIAALVERHAAALLRETVALARAVGTCEWDGPAARHFRADAGPVLGLLRGVAGRLDAAAEELRRVR